MLILCHLIFTLILCITPCRADAVERVGLYSTNGSTVTASEIDSIPAWAVNIPEHSFVGISTSSPSIEMARQQAFDSAIGQILQAMGAEYQLNHESVLSGDMNQSRYELKERLSYTARWLLNSVQQNIKQYTFQSTGDGHVCFVLVHMRPSDLEKLKRLTIGSRLTARVVGIGDGRLSIEVSELNGVSVVLSEYRVTFAVTHTNARLITLFFWKVPQTNTHSIDSVLPKPLSLNNGSGNTVITVTNGMSRLTSIIMGSQQDMSISLTGHDEIGRPVTVPVRMQ